MHNYQSDNLFKTRKPETKNTSIDQKNYKDLVIFFTTYVHSKSIIMLSLNYYKLIGVIEEHEGKNI